MTSKWKGNVKSTAISLFLFATLVTTPSVNSHLLAALSDRRTTADTDCSSIAYDFDYRHFFTETGYSIVGCFYLYWRANGGLTQQGYPISEPIFEISPSDGKQYVVQYFERAKFQRRPDHDAPNPVMLSLLGNQLYQQRYPAGALGQRLSSDNPYYFPQTGHSIGGKFRTYWERHGGLPQQGYPISDEFTEQASDGKSYTVQYFERARFEYHSEYVGTPYEVLLGQLGWQGYQQQYLPLQIPDDDRLASLSMISSVEGWAVGYQGTILHYKDGKWQRVASPMHAGTHSFFRAVKMVSADDGWIVGYTGDRAGIILRYQADHWQYVDDIAPAALYDLSMVSPTLGWAIGYQGADGVALPYKDGAWKEFQSAGENVMSGIDMVSADEGWAVGAFDLAHYYEGRWQRSAAPTGIRLLRVRMASVTAGWIAGTAILHYNGSQWVQESSEAANDIGIAPNGEVWAVGGEGKILHRGDGQWASVPSPTSRSLNAIQMLSPTEGWAVGDAGTILHYQDGVWSVYNF